MQVQKLKSANQLANRIPTIDVIYKWVLIAKSKINLSMDPLEHDTRRCKIGFGTRFFYSISTDFQENPHEIYPRNSKKIPTFTAKSRTLAS